ncbi:MAG: ATP-dependent Clp protease proteolytic subunit [Bacteroidales bacterium]
MANGKEEGTITIEDLAEMCESADVKDTEGELKNRIISIDSEIDTELMNQATIPLMEMDSDGTNEPITILINTPGGDVYNGLALCKVIQKLKTPTTVRILGAAMSMGVLIAMAGHNNPNVKTICDEFSVGLLHQGYQALSGSCSNVGSLYEFNIRYEKRVEKYIFENSDITEHYYDTIKYNDTWLDSDDMLKYGIVDEII